MAFYARPTRLISPGDIFPEIPITVPVPPLRVARKSSFSPKAKFGPQDLRRIYTLPDDGPLLPNLKLGTKAGEETLTPTRVGMAMFLSWGSQVEADERDVRQSSDPKRKSWLCAPIYNLHDVPESAVLKDAETGEEISIRNVVRNNLSHNYFYLPPYPTNGAGTQETEHYVDFRKICSVGIGYFTSSRDRRLAALCEGSLNSLFSRLMWFFTRAEYFFHPVVCKTCGLEVPIDIRFEGQNLDAEPWE